MIVNDKKASLIRYAESLQQRLQAQIPSRHAHRPEAYLEMLRIDLKKTKNRIDKL